MMENAGRNLAGNALEMLDGQAGGVAILVGGGGNGGGGLCCARHLHNRGIPVQIVLDRPPLRLSPAALAQWRVLQEEGLPVTVAGPADEIIACAGLIVDALIGYGLRAAPSGGTAALIRLSARGQAPVLSLDVPSGRDATSGYAPGDVVMPERTLTLALPKTGLVVGAGELVLADIGIPPEVFARAGIHVEEYFGSRCWVPLERSPA